MKPFNKRGSITGVNLFLIFLAIIGLSLGGLISYPFLKESYFPEEQVGCTSSSDCNMNQNCDLNTGKCVDIVGTATGKTATVKVQVKDYASLSPTQIATTFNVWEMTETEKNAKTSFGTAGKIIKQSTTSSSTADTNVGSETGKYLDIVAFSNVTGSKYIAVKLENVQVTETPTVEVKTYKAMEGCPLVQIIENGQPYTPGTTACAGSTNCGDQPNTTIGADGTDSYDYIKITANETNRVLNLAGIVWDSVNTDTNISDVTISDSLGIERQARSKLRGETSITASISDLATKLDRYRGGDYLFTITPNVLMFENDIFKTGLVTFNGGGQNPIDDPQVFYIVSANGYLDQNLNYGYGMEDKGSKKALTSSPDCGYGINVGGAS